MGDSIVHNFHEEQSPVHAVTLSVVSEFYLSVAMHSEETEGHSVPSQLICMLNEIASQPAWLVLFSEPVIEQLAQILC